MDLDFEQVPPSRCTCTTEPEFCPACVREQVDMEEETARAERALLESTRWEDLDPDERRALEELSRWAEGEATYFEDEY